MVTEIPPSDMDAVTAHLDRAWERLEKNDLVGAEKSARKALDTAPEAAEAMTMLGLVAAARGDEQGALDFYDRAMSTDPSYVAPKLYAAELLLMSADDDKTQKEGLKLINEALENAEEEDEYLDALILKAEILISLGDHEDEAKELLAELPPITLPEAVPHVRAGQCYLALGLVAQAEDQFRRAVEVDPENSEAFYGLGNIHAEKGDHEAMVAAWLKVRELDAKEPEPAWRISDCEFVAIADKALEELPEKARTHIENVPIVASDYPSVEIISEGNDPRSLGLFSGVPFPEKRNLGGSEPHLDCITLYKRNIERICRNSEEAAEEVRLTILHETGHFFGLDESELEEMGLG